MTSSRAPTDVVARIRELLERATPGPWCADGEIIWHESAEDALPLRCCEQPLNSGECCGKPVPAGNYGLTQEQLANARPQDAALIAALVNAAPALLDELAAARKALEWQPIETAPRSPTEIVVAVPAPERAEGCIIGGAYWREDEDHEDGGEWWWANTAPDYYTDTILNTSSRLPTHWRPLPPPPQENKP